MELDDQKWMRLALEEAKKAFALDEVPIGAIVVFENQVIARAHNLLESTSDPSSHAELLAIRSAAQFLGNWRLQGATLYCTLEPCIMCAGALIQARMGRLVFGAPDIRQGAYGSFLNLLDHPHPIHSFSVTRGVLEQECGEILRQFFRLKRAEKKEDLFGEMISLQKQKLAQYAETKIPHLTEEDLLQPNDFPVLENDPYFRYEEGFLHGLLSSQMAIRASEASQK